MTYRSLSLATIALLLGAAVAPAQAQSGAQAGTQPGEIVYVDLGRWAIYERTYDRVCELRLRAQDGLSLAYAKSGGSPGLLRLSTARGSGFGGEVVWSFDDTQIGGRTLGNRVYAPISDTGTVETEFRRARFLTLTHGGATLARISLQYSSAGFRLLEQCADQWRGGYGRAVEPRIAEAAPSPAAPPPAARSEPPPPPATPAPTTTMASDPVPRRPGEWIRPDTYIRLPTRNWGGGVVEFTLAVDRRGRVERCVVDRTSGSSEFDELTCDELQRRARFDPATDANGNAVAGRYSSSVKFELPE